MVNLKKLYLEKNMISKLDGLDNCRKLEEIYLGNQELPPTVEFTFDEYSLAAISGSIRLLDLPNSRVVNPKPLYYLEGLDTLNLRDNLIADFEHQVCPILQTMNCLRILNLSKNPVTQITKYRDQVVLLSRSVQELDGKDVTESERKYLVSLISRKKVQGTVYNEVKKKKENFVVDGHSFAVHHQKKFLLDNIKNKHQIETMSFEDFLRVHGSSGEDPENIENDFQEYLKY